MGGRGEPRARACARLGDAGLAQAARGVQQAQPGQLGVVGHAVQVRPGRHGHAAPPQPHRVPEQPPVAHARRPARVLAHVIDAGHQADPGRVRARRKGQRGLPGVRGGARAGAAPDAASAAAVLIPAGAVTVPGPRQVRPLRRPVPPPGHAQGGRCAGRAAPARACAAGRGPEAEGTPGHTRSLAQAGSKETGVRVFGKGAVLSLERAPASTLAAGFTVTLACA